MSGPDTELARIEAILTADSPQPSPAFTAEMDQRVREGFPKPKRQGQGAGAYARLRRLWIPSLAAATALIVVAVVALSSIGGEDRVTSAFHAGQASKNAGPAVDGLQSFSNTGPAPAADLARRVERSVELTIATPHDDLQKAADGVGTVAESHGGFVLSSHVNTSDQGGGGTFTLRVPQRELQATVADISKLGHLKARSESGQDMTASYNDVQDKLGNALLERSALKRKLHRAKGSDADRIRGRIEALNAAISTLNGRMHDLKRRTSYSTVDVTLEQQKNESGGTGAAWSDAQRTLQAMLDFTVRLLAVLLPLALIAAIAALGARTFRRRRREAPLL
jgi:Domain of unknown function (DUF4349)